MTQLDFERALIVMAAWRLASSSDVNELTAVACVLRNAVVRGRQKSYGEAVNYYMASNPLRPHPVGNEPQLVDPFEGLLSAVDGIYDNSTPDITASMAFPLGASSFANVRRNPEFSAGKTLVGKFGGQHFFV